MLQYRPANGSWEEGVSFQLQLASNVPLCDTDCTNWEFPEQVPVTRKSRADLSKPESPSTASIADAKLLLDSANQASTQAAVLHVAFMALCAYVLIIVFGTKDIDLLIGKGVKLPLVDVEVPIVGFYTFAPYLVVLVHFNLLLQLLLLSRKLNNFD